MIKKFIRIILANIGFVLFSIGFGFGLSGCAFMSQLPPEKPITLSATDVIDEWVINAPKQPKFNSLNESQYQKLLFNMSKLDSLSNYPYSACHDRAHLLFQMVPPELHDYVGKIWLLSPELISLTEVGTIRLNAGPEDISWEYHVALTFFAPNNEQVVIDPALGTLAMPISVNNWVNMMITPKGSVIASLSGEYYLFNNYGDKKTWKGSLWTLSENSCLQPRKGAAMAVVGARLLAEADIKCGLKRYSTRPLNLLWLLEEGNKRDFTDSQCQNLYEIYNNEVIRLSNVLGSCIGDQLPVGEEPEGIKWKDLFEEKILN